METDLKLNTSLIKSKIKEKNWNQKKISEKLGVSEATISYWLSGEKLPEYNNLKTICQLLDISFKDAYIKDDRFIYRFRKNRQSRETPKDKNKVDDITSALSELLPILENDEDFTNEPLRLRKPIISYNYFQSASKAIREKLNEKTSIESILRFITTDLNTIIVPVLWSEKKPFCNALQITDKIFKISFLYLNLNSKGEDIKFWLLHEAAHILSPEIDNEEFADTLAGSILFPEDEAFKVYNTLKGKNHNSQKVQYLKKLANFKEIAAFTIFKQIEAFERHYMLDTVLPEKQNLFIASTLIEDFLINENSIDAHTYINISKNRYKTKIFDYLQEYLQSDNTITPHYIRRLLNISIEDSQEIFKALKNEI